jgi:hypothetical protein
MEFGELFPFLSLERAVLNKEYLISCLDGPLSTLFWVSSNSGFGVSSIGTSNLFLCIILKNIMDIGLDFLA